MMGVGWLAEEALEGPEGPEGSQVGDERRTVRTWDGESWRVLMSS